MKKHLISIAPLTDDSTLRRVGIFLVIAIFGGLGGWAALAPLSSAAHAPGQVTVENYRKTVQHLEGGIIDSIRVRDGDWVEKGQIMVTLNDTQPRAQLEVLRGQYLITMAREARLVALRDDQSRIKYPPELLEARGDPRAAEAMRVQNQTFQARRQSLDNEVHLYQEQIGQLRAKERGLQAQKTGREQLMRSYEAELNDFQTLLKEGYSEKQTVRDLERKFASSQGENGELQSNLAAVNLQMSEIQLKVLQLKKSLQSEVVKELAEVQMNLFELHEKIHALEQTVERSVIKAPDAGKVLGLAVHTLGGVIAPGSRILEIVPQNEKLLVEAHVSPMDIDRVKIGQGAEIRFSVFRSKDLPRIEGKVLALSADSLVSEDPQHTPYYLARVEVNAEGLETLTRLNLELLPGMPAEVLIRTGKRTLFQYLADPLSDSFSRSFIED
ncbi:HlyD family type I secretion periplasmic adaptor subunit [Candidatus Methylospira mobilis]|uniref:Membrane fusion protein (MFP) family protein n=1 Tax=Candidatus Methylospira mobilis TaxID=1808979 RepID=A0A5Q0BCY9_9GAMM|nr:HlyD family type I secretion periplasmic adaptor subunit [Candidatus Methylospira mobilis]QFY41389.1 HlyD family type I secretion periplasmic adaptor subunit [Candidatus Methylospira mobilis]